jgi:hypothetical protein
VADESNAFLEFVVSLSAPSTQTVTVSYNNSNSTAANGSDYVAKASTLTFLPGQTTHVVKIPVLDTAGAEPTEAMVLNLFGAVNAQIGAPIAQGVIFDNDAASGTPVVRVLDQVVDEASGQVSFVVALSRPSVGTVSVNVATVNGTAVAGSDFVAPATQTLTFRPGEMVKTVDVALINDTASEGREFFDLRLSSPVGATLLAQPTGRATIGASDAAPVALPRITVSDAISDETATWLEFVVSLSAPSTQRVSVSYNNSNVTAANGSDYGARASTLTFAPGETTKVVKIPLLDNAVAERGEFLGLNLFSPVNATVARPFALGKIVDNDAASGTPAIRVEDAVVDEASGQVSIAVVLDRPSVGNVSVNVATASGSAASGSDFQAVPATTLTFLPGEVLKVVNVALVNDTAAEPGEYFNVALSAPVGATLPDTLARVFIAPSDAAAVALPRISVSDASANESDTELSFVLSLSAPSTQPVSVSYNNSNITAANGSDYVALASTVTFAPGETTLVVKIPVLDNLVAEPTELARLNLFSPVNATLARAGGYGHIVDNDQASGTPVISVSDAVVDESQARAAFTVSLDKPSVGQVRVNYATANGNAAAGSDYESQATQTLVFGPGETSKTVFVNLRADTVAEGPEFFDLTLSGAVGATIGDVRGHAVIGQSDMAAMAQPVISAAAIAAPETGTVLEFVVSLNAPSTQVVSVGFNNSNGTAANGSDYAALSGTLVFQPGETVHVLRFPVLDNLVAEPSETFGLNLFSAVNAVIGTSSVVGTILDNDGAPLPGQLVNNGTGNADVLVGRPGANAVAGLGGNDLLDGVNGVAMNGGSGNDVYIVESATDTVSESGGSGTDTVVAYVDHTLGAGLEHLLLRGSAVNGTGNTASNTVAGHAGTNVLNGKAGADSLTGGGGTNTFVFDSTVGGFDTVTDWTAANDTLRFSMAALHVGDSDTLVENGLVRSAAGGFAPNAEVVIFTSDIVGTITAAAAAAKIGSATAAYATGAHALFAVDNGTQTGVFLFTSSGTDAAVGAAELVQVALLNGGITGLTDYTFSA